MIAAVGLAVLLAGAMIGLTGIGGVLVVPALTALGNVALDRAVAASLLGFLVAGVPAAVVHLRRTRVPARQALVLGLLAGAGALAGAWTLDRLPEAAVRVFIALLAISSGCYALSRAGAATSAPRVLPTVLIGPLALVIGYASAISGTGGPVLLVPVLLLLGTAARTAIALGLAVQIPVTALATAVNFAEGRVDLALAAPLAALLILGMAAGTWLSGRLSPRATMRCVAITLIAVGVAYGMMQA